MRVAVGSTNRVKTQAVEHVCDEVFDVDVSVIAVDVDPGVSPQPFNGEIARGALTRAERARSLADADWGVGIEAGVSRQPGAAAAIVTQIAAVVDREGRVTWGTSPGFELPAGVSALLATGETLADAMRSVHGDSFDDDQGAIAVLSGGRITRADLTRSAVEMALVPRLGPRDERAPA